MAAPGGGNGIDWLWVRLAVIVDIGFWSGGAYRNRDRMRGSASTV